MKLWLGNVLHNTIVHPLMPFLPKAWGEALHDWSLQFWPPREYSPSPLTPTPTSPTGALDMPTDTDTDTDTPRSLVAEIRIRESVAAIREALQRLPSIPELPVDLAKGLTRRRSVTSSSISIFTGEWDVVEALQEAADLVLEVVETFGLDQEDTIKQIAAQLDGGLTFKANLFGRILEQLDGPIIEVLLRRAVARLKAQAA